MNTQPPPKFSPFSPGETDVVTYQVGGKSLPPGISIAASPPPTATPPTASGISCSTPVITSDAEWTTPNTNLLIRVTVADNAKPGNYFIQVEFWGSDGVRVKPRGFVVPVQAKLLSEG